MVINQKCFNDEMGIYLKKIREENNLTLDQMSLITGINSTTISNFERGKHQISTWRLMVIREIFDLNPHEYFKEINRILDKCRSACPIKKHNTK